MDIFDYLSVAFGWAFFAFWIWMLVDCIKNEDDKIERVTWALFIIFIAPLFAPLYYVRCYRQRQKDKKKDEKTPA